MGVLTAIGRLGSIGAQFTNGYLIGPPPHIDTLLVIASMMMIVCSLCTLTLGGETRGVVLK